MNKLVNKLVLLLFIFASFGLFLEIARAIVPGDQIGPGSPNYSLITVQTGTLVGGTATKTVPSGCHPWAQDNASSLTNVGTLTVTVSGTTATITSTNVLDTSPYTLYNAGSL